MPISIVLTFLKMYIYALTFHEWLFDMCIPFAFAVLSLIFFFFLLLFFFPIQRSILSLFYYSIPCEFNQRMIRFIRYIFERVVHNSNKNANRPKIRWKKKNPVEMPFSLVFYNFRFYFTLLCLFRCSFMSKFDAKNIYCSGGWLIVHFNWKWNNERLMARLFRLKEEEEEEESILNFPRINDTFSLCGIFEVNIYCHRVDRKNVGVCAAKSKTN